ncbi:MAG: carbon monoxide dehydrogenase subunit G [Deltaproteobacteria bacterium]|nr:carbon monoxide dehydrogenase subunit G [Deltaproteobacteria bacterium]
MKINGTQTFPAARQRVWEFLIDPQRLARCLPGCEKLEAVGENEYASQINVGLAAVKGVYTGKVKLDEMQPPSHYKMLIDGKGKQGFIKGHGTLDLAEQNGQTLLTYSGDVQVGGPLASVGQRMVDGAAKMMIGQFFTAMEAELQAMPGEEVRQGAAVNFWRYLLKLLREKLAALFGKKTPA